MFGWINDCTETLIVSKFGIEKWHEIKKKAGCEVRDNGFIRHESYSDESTIALVVAASEVLGLTVEQVLEAFGQFFMEFVRRKGYENMLNALGSNMRSWLSNLNALHDHLASSLPSGFIAPVFWCEDDEEFSGCILVHYFSKRGNLLVSLVVGLIKEVARFHFLVEINMDMIAKQGENDSKWTTWRISTKDSSLSWKLTSNKSSSANGSESDLTEDILKIYDEITDLEVNGEAHGNCSKAQSFSTPQALDKKESDEANRPTNSAQCPKTPSATRNFQTKGEDITTAQNNNYRSTLPRRVSCPFAKMKPSECNIHSLGKTLEKETRCRKRKISTSSESPLHKKCKVENSCPHDIPTAATTDSSISLSSEQMKVIFPHHVVVDIDFTILQVGKDFRKLIQGVQSPLNRHIADVLTIVRPVFGQWEWKALNKLRDQTFFVETAANNVNKYQSIKLKGNMINIKQDPLQVLLILSPDCKNISEMTQMNITMSDLPLHSFQRDVVFLGEHISSEVRSAHMLDRLSKKLEKEKSLSNALLHQMLPVNVANDLRRGMTVEPEYHENVTLFFSDIVGFTDLCSGLEPWKIIAMLNKLYTLMDLIAKKFGLYKIETIGDAYVACSGLPKADENHAFKVANFALVVRECIKEVKSPVDGKPLNLRMGIHTGCCMAGVVGNLMPKYCIFGDFVNTASRHESTAIPNCIQCSETFYNEITSSSLHIQPQYVIVPRSELVEMKGKGKLKTFWLNSATNNNTSANNKEIETAVEESRAILQNEVFCKRKYFSGMRSSIISTSSVGA